MIFTGIGVLLRVCPVSCHLMCACITLSSGSERCYIELWSTRPPLWAHPFFPPASQPLHSDSSHTGDDLVIREDHGAGSLCSGAFDKGNEGGVNQWVYPLCILFHGWLRDREVYEENSGKDRCGRCGWTIRYAHERRESNDGSEKLGGHTPGECQ